MRARFTATAILISILLGSPAGNADAPAQGDVHHIVIDGTINPATSEFLQNSISAAEKENAEALLIEMDTPGGVLASTQSMVREILNSPVPVIVFVAPKGARAASAGTFILMAAHVAAMAPGTRVGAAHPVTAGGQDIGDDMRTKAENDTAAFIESIAKQRGRNAEWAVQAVRESTSITEDEALKLRVVDLVAEDRSALLEEVDGRKVQMNGEERVLRTKGASLVTHEMTFINRIIDALSHPNIAVLLFLGGLLGLYVEFTHPGLLFPGIAGAICLILFFIAGEVLPLNYAGFALVGLGIALLVAELFVPSFGLLFIGGMVALTLGLLLLFDTPESDLRVSFWGVLFPAMLALGVFGGLILYGVTRIHLTPQRSGVEGLVGARGEARSNFSRARGKVFVAGEWWNAISEEPIRSGEPIEVLGVKGMVLKVRKAQGG
jgi:membrane-bound serine protease (ClpP class)